MTTKVSKSIDEILDTFVFSCIEKGTLAHIDDINKAKQALTRLLLAEYRRGYSAGAMAKTREGRKLSRYTEELRAKFQKEHPNE